MNSIRFPLPVAFVALVACNWVGLPCPALAADSGLAVLNAQLPAGSSLSRVSESVFLDLVRRAAASQPDFAPQIAEAAARVAVGSPSPIAPTAEGLAAIAIAAIEGATPEEQVPDPALVNAVIEAVARGATDGGAATASTTGVSDGRQVVDFNESVDIRGARTLPTDEVIAAMTEIVLNRFPARFTRTGLRSIADYNYTVPPDARRAPTPVQEGEEELRQEGEEELRPRPTPVVPPKEEVTPFRPSSR